MTSSSSIDVLIVGAGPTGLMLGCQLSLYPNVSFRIIDKNSSSTTQSRALGVHARSLELFAQLNIIDQAMSQGTFMDSLNLFFQGKRSLRLDITKFRTENTLFTHYPYLFMIEQSVTESILEKFLNEHNIKVERQKEAIDLSDVDSSDNSEIQVTLSTGEVIRTKYVCACDGARSLVRHKLNLPFSGRTFTESLFVADCDIENSPLQRKDVGIFFHSTGFVGLFPFANSRSRFFGTIRETVEEDPNLTIDQVATMVKVRTQNNTMKISNNYWISIYHSHHRCVEKFRHRKQYFLLGDAAHIHSPVGGQGMNTGLQDAHNLAWKLGHVLTHKADDRLLDTYQEERSAFAKALVNTVDLVFSFLSSTNWMVSILRLYLLPFLLRFVVQPMFSYSRTVRKKLFRAVSQLGFTYNKYNPYNSMASTGKFAETTPKPGDRFPLVIFEPCFHHFVVFEKDEQKVKPFIEYLKANYSKLIKFHNAQEEKIPFQFEGAFLIRPDGYIFYRTNDYDINNFESYFGQFYSK